MRVRDKNHRDTARSCTDLRVPTGTLYRGKTADKSVGDVDIVLTADARELQQGLSIKRLEFYYLCCPVSHGVPSSWT